MAGLALLTATGGGLAQPADGLDPARTTRSALADARAQGAEARQRAERLEAEAAKATDEAERTARLAAAVAARIQQAEADIAERQSRIAAIGVQRARLRANLASRQKPIVELTAALQRMARRPAVLSLLRPGSLKETIRTRALLAAMLPEVERRTAALRAEIERSRALQVQAALAARDLRRTEQVLLSRHKALAVVESRQRLALRSVSIEADRESERALAMAEQARDLSALVSALDRAAALRLELESLPGPILRPAQPAAARVAAAVDRVQPVAALTGYMLPVAGRLVAGFGEAGTGTPRSRGITLATRVGALAVSPAPGRVVFAGPYSGYGQIVIIEHRGGWTSLVTGLAQLDTRVGVNLVAGSPLGQAGGGQPRITLELRRGGVPVNPLDHIRPS